MTKTASFVLSIKDTSFLPIDLSDECQDVSTICQCHFQFVLKTASVLI